MKDFFLWIERKLWLGEVVRDYGCVAEQKMGGAFIKTFLLLCRRKGELQIVVKTAGFAFLSASVSYAYLPASAATAFKEIADDIEDLSAKESSNR